MQGKIYLLSVLLLLIVDRSTTYEQYSPKIGSSSYRTRNDGGVDRDEFNEKDDQIDDDYASQASYRRNRYSPRGDYRQQRTRWQLPYEESSDVNDWSRFKYGLNGLLPNFPSPSSPPAFDHGAYVNHGPQCHSLLDPQYPLFSDICGAVPQARYSLPNSFGHFERWQISQILTAVLGPTAPVSSNPSCTRSLRLLLCPLLFPPCSTRHEPPPVLPCQPFCRMVKNQCATPSLDLLPCDLLPHTSDLCPINPTPYSSLLSSFGQPTPFNGGLSQSALASILAQSAMSPSGVPSSAFPSLLSASGRSRSPLNLFNGDSYMADSITPILVDFPPLPVENDYRQAPRYFPSSRSQNLHA